jgi:hypothetical protein
MSGLMGYLPPWGITIIGRLQSKRERERESNLHLSEKKVTLKGEEDLVLPLRTGLHRRKASHQSSIHGLIYTSDVALSLSNGGIHLGINYSVLNETKQDE